MAMFMDNKALLDQLMGKDRNASTFKGLREQWKDSSMCKAYLLDFCPHELFYNTRMFIGNCQKTHSDVVKHQYEISEDLEKSSWTRRSELDLLSQLEKIIDSVDHKIRRQRHRVNASVPEYRLSAEKESLLEELNLQISLGMKQVEKLAEIGQFDESTLLMAKVNELTAQASDIQKDKYSQVVKKEIVCDVCGVLTGAGVDEDGRPERPHDHVRGKQHSGMELIRRKVIQIKRKFKINLNARDKAFSDSHPVELPTDAPEGDVVQEGPHEERPSPVRRSRDRSLVRRLRDMSPVRRSRDRGPLRRSRDRGPRGLRRSRDRSPVRRSRDSTPRGVRLSRDSPRDAPARKMDDTHDEFGRLRRKRSISVSSAGSAKSLVSVCPY